jgi:hypothetical protein
VTTHPEREVSAAGNWRHEAGGGTGGVPSRGILTGDGMVLGQNGYAGKKRKGKLAWLVLR